MIHLMLNSTGIGLSTSLDRGSIHCHGVPKLKYDTGLCRRSEITLKGHLEKKSKDGDIAIVKDGEAADATTCKYVDWLLSTHNPNSPEEIIIRLTL